MKNNLIKFLLPSFLLIAMFSCKKDENQIFLEGGKTPVLSKMSIVTDSVLLRVNRDKEFVFLKWTNPEYRFTTGPSSQDVTYTLQIDTVGSNFTNPKIQEISISKDLGKSISIGDMNNYLTKMELAVDITHNIEIRVVSNLNNAAKLYSNAIRFFRIKMYEDFAVNPPTSDQLFVVGDGTSTGWNNNPASPEFATRVSKGLYVDTIMFESGKFYKFLAMKGQWQPQYGLKKDNGNSTSGDLGLNDGTTTDPEAIPTPGTGLYIVTLNFTTGKYTVVPK